MVDEHSQLSLPGLHKGHGGRFDRITMISEDAQPGSDRLEVGGILTVWEKESDGRGINSEHERKDLSPKLHCNKWSNKQSIETIILCSSHNVRD